MKTTTVFLGFALLTGLLAGCGGSGSDAVIIGKACDTDAQCDDGDFCSGIEVCLAGACIQLPRCDQSDPCAPEECVGFPVETCRRTCAAAGPADACCGDPACDGEPICVGEPYLFTVTGLTQESPPCPFTPLQIAIILELFSGTHYTVKLPLPDAVFTTVDIVLPIPIIGPLTVTAQRVGGELVFEPQTLEDIDLGQLGVLGFNCRVGGTAGGQTVGFGDDSVEVTVSITAMSVETGSGTGACTLGDPGPACVLELVSEGTIQDAL